MKKVKTRIFFQLFVVVFLVCCNNTFHACEGLLRGNLEGVDGDLVVSSSSSTILNRYFKVTSFPSTTIVVLSTAPIPALESGALVFLYQANGAAINETNTNEFGEVLDLKGSGLYEFAVISNNVGARIEVMAPLSRMFDPLGADVQMVVVPQYETLTVESEGTVSSIPWSPSEGVGGLVVLHSRSIFLAGTVTTSGAGFLGGTAMKQASGRFCLNKPSDQIKVPRSISIATSMFHPVYNWTGAMKGEGIRRKDSSFSNSFGRGAPANGGGGGSIHNSGGGGGSNAALSSSSSSTSWDGSGV